MIPADFHFLRPAWLLTLIPLLLLLVYLFKRGLGSRQWESVCDPELLPYILIGRSGRKKYLPEMAIGLIGLVMILALAGPTWKHLPQPVYKKESALVIALDLSLSMYAKDIHPSRLERARFEIADLLSMRKEGQTALLVYSGDAFTVTPLTDDVKTIKSQLSALSPKIMPSTGSNTELALKLATGLLSQAGMRHGDILLVTDEINPRYVSAISDASRASYRVSILGVGTSAGAPISLVDGSFLETPDGKVVIPKLDKAALKKMAVAGGGIYQNSRIDDSDITRLQALFMDSNYRDKEMVSDLQSDIWYEFGPWLLLPLLPLVAFGFRRGILCMLVAVLCAHNNPVYAFDWDALWLNDNQRAHRAMQRGRAEAAAKLFNDPKWRAAAKYRAGDYAAAEKILDGKTDEDSIYNRANALAQMGRYKEAVAAYEKILQNNPEHKDARHNKELLEQVLQKQQADQKQNHQGENKDGNKDQNAQNPDSGHNRQQSGSHGESEQQDDMQSEQTQGMAKQQDANIKQNPMAEGDNDEPSVAQDSGNDEQEMTRQAQANKPDEEQQAQEQWLRRIQDDPSGTDEPSVAQDSGNDEQEMTRQAQANKPDEEQQAQEQWLRRIPDDPSDLLRRKFKYQYQQLKRQKNDDQYW